MSNGIQQVHHQTKRGAELALAKKQISQESYRAVTEGRISLQEARELGRGGSPYGPVAKVNKGDRSRECLCGCGKRSLSGRFAQGHDMRMVALAKSYMRGERELTEEQTEYIEESGKLEQARQRVIAEDERAAHKEDRQREKQANASE